MNMRDSASTIPARLKWPQVVAAYRRIAPVYDLWGRMTESRAQSVCLEWAAIKDGEDVLDVAVGTGLLFVRLLSLNPSGFCAGLDLSDAMLRKARIKADRVAQGRWQLVRGDAFMLPWPNDRFDVVINNYMFDLLPERDFSAVLAEFGRVLRNGGRLVMVNMTSPEHWHQRTWGLVYRISPTLLGGCRGVRLQPWLRSGGFEVIKRQFVSQMSFPSEVILARWPTEIPGTTVTGLSRRGAGGDSQ